MKHRVAFSLLDAPLVGMAHSTEERSDEIARRAFALEYQACSESLSFEAREAPRLTPTLARALLTLITHSGQIADVKPAAIEEPCRSDAIVS